MERNRVTEVLDSMNANFRSFAHDRAKGMDNAYETIAQAAFEGVTAKGIADMCEVLAKHTMDDIEKPYGVCYGEREFYQMAHRLFNTLTNQLKEEKC